MNVIKHTRSLDWVAICFYFIIQSYALYIAFAKCFYICDNVVVKFLYKTFLIHITQNCLHSSPCITIKLGSGYTLGGCMGCSLVNFGFVLRHKANSWSCAQIFPLYKNTSVLLVSECEYGKKFMFAVFSKSLALRTKVPFNTSVISVCLSFQFDWRNFARALATRISIAESTWQLLA